jgi:hypothetical protein
MSFMVRIYPSPANEKLAIEGLNPYGAYTLPCWLTGVVL